MARIRVELVVRGVVQGVGFRPFLHRLAREHGLGGLARNDGRGVVVEVEGGPAAVAAFAADIRRRAPARAEVREIRRRSLRPTGESGFVIRASTPGPGAGARIPPDVATCDACLRELTDPADRRAGYPFINCTDCGPRFTIVRDLPYDRSGTTMASFAMCPRCSEEFDDPASRRHHAQPNACPDCGPRVVLRTAHGPSLAGDEAVADAVRRLERGQILAVKGLGGYHLACDAANGEAVRRLRRLKNRPHRPFAVMARDLDVVGDVALLRPGERRALSSWRRPIVLLEAREGGPVDGGVGGSSRWIGVMLPYTPLHHLLLRGSLRVLVMTSGNLSGAPIITADEDALRVLGGMADGVLLHDRVIAASAEDSVLRVIDRGAVLLRRGRGFVPDPVRLPRGGPPVLAIGGDLRGACGITRGEEACLGPHVGDLEHPDAQDALAGSVAHLRRLLGVRPRLVVHDQHPGYHGTALARSLDLPALAIQHHHAHALSCLAEHGVDAPALALILDGAGHGSDGAVWGGELLAVDGLTATRHAHLRYRALPGGDRAAREPWRMALSMLRDVAGGPARPPAWEGEEVASPREMEAVAALCRSESTPRTSSAGRLFDAAASLLGLCHRATFDGQAALALEQAAERSRARGTLPYTIRGGGGGPLEIDLAPALAELAYRGAHLRRRSAAARLFHRTVAAAVTEATVRVAGVTGLRVVALGGGVFQNRLLTELVVASLRRAGLPPLVHRQVPPGDGGLALGQLWAGVLWQARAGGSRRDFHGAAPPVVDGTNSSSQRGSP